MDLFSRLSRGRISCRFFPCGVGKTSPRASIVVRIFFSYSGPSGILLGSDGKQDTV